MRRIKWLKVMTLIKACLIAFILIQIINNQAEAQEWDIVTLNNPAPGYIKYDGLDGINFFVVDNYGRMQYPIASYDTMKIHHYKPLRNGYWAGTSIENFRKAIIFDENIHLIDSIGPPAGYLLDWHDIDVMPNGHYLLLCTQDSTMDLSVVVEGGDTAARVIAAVLIETDRLGTVYWTWKALDHMNILDVTRDVDLTQKNVEFNHANSITIDNDGNVLLSSRHLDEITKISRTTGEIIWRLGGTECRNNEFTFLNDASGGFVGFSHQHSVSVLENGNILLFDNGNLKPTPYTRVVEYSIDETNKTVTKVWEYLPNPDIYCPIMGNAQRLPNGNTLICFVVDKIVEVRNDNSIALEIRLRTFTAMYRAFKTTWNMNAVSRTLSGNGNYSYNEQNNETNVSINVSSINGSGLTAIEKHYYIPPISSFVDYNFSFLLPYRWVFSQRGVTNLNGTIKFNVSDLMNNEEPHKLSIYKRSKESDGNFVELNTSYNSGTNEIYANFSGFGEFVIGSYVLSKPVLLSPGNGKYGANVSGKLIWNKLIGASKFRLQLSRFEDFSQLSVNQLINNDTSFTCQNLLFNTDYFWRISGMNLKDTSEWSDIYKFTTELSVPELTQPENRKIGTKLNDTLRWNEVSGAEKYCLEVSKDSLFVHVELRDNNLSSNERVLSSMDFNTKYFWRILAYRTTDTSKWSETRCFTTTLEQPTLSIPIDNSINIEINGFIYWIAVPGAEKYHIQISKNKNMTPLLIEKFDISQTSCIFDNLLYNSIYYFRVKALRDGDSSSWSELFKFTTILKSPDLYEPVNNFVFNGEDVVLRWESSDGALTYSMQVSLNPDFDSLLILDETGMKTNEYLIDELPPHRKIFWRVKAISDKKYSNWSEAYSFDSGKGVPIDTVLLYSPMNNSENNHASGVLSWQAVNKALTYSLQVSSNEDFSTILLYKRDINLTSDSYSDFNSNEYYYWRVKAHSKYDSSDWSKPWKFKTEGKPSLQLVQLIFPGYNDLQVSLSGKILWEPIKNAYYILQVCDNADFINPVYNLSNLQLASFDYSGLLSNTEYYWRVKYILQNETSDWSDIWYFTTASSIILNTPVLEHPSNNQAGVPIEGNLEWSNMADASFYHLMISQNEDFYPAVVSERGLSANKFTYSMLEYNKRYYWHIASANNNSTSQWSEPRKFLTEIEMPLIISPIYDSIGLAVSGTLHWLSNESAGSYNLQIAKDSLFEHLRTDLIINDTVYEYNLSDNSIYYWRVKALNDSNYSRWSRDNFGRVYKFVIGYVTDVNSESITTNSELSDVSLFPNPVKEIFYLSFNVVTMDSDNRNQASFSIKNLLGTTVYQEDFVIFEKGKHTYNFSIDYLKTGFYFAELRMNGYYKMMKMVVQE